MNSTMIKPESSVCFDKKKVKPNDFEDDSMIALGICYTWTCCPQTYDLFHGPMTVAVAWTVVGWSQLRHMAGISPAHWPEKYHSDSFHRRQDTQGLSHDTRDCPSVDFSSLKTKCLLNSLPHRLVVIPRLKLHNNRGSLAIIWIMGFSHGKNHHSHHLNHGKTQPVSQVMPSLRNIVLGPQIEAKGWTY